MSLKAKLVSTISAFCLVLALMVVGVLAATSSTISMSGSISFTAQDIVGSVVLTGTGITEHKAEFDSKKGDASYEWDDLNLSFTKGQTIELKLVITNAATDGRKIGVNFTTDPEVTGASNVKVSTSYNSTDLATTPSFEVANGTPVTITITFTCSDFNNNFTGNWTSVFTLTNVAAPAGDAA